ncbi:MAG: pseudouridine synthase, partial [Bacilli bacterium]|nr:pseudouridine synthase [Bacilli bacterium]
MSQLDNQTGDWQDNLEEEEELLPALGEQETLPPNSTFEWIIQGEPVGARLDRFLVQEMPQLSRNQVQNWIGLGNILVQGQASKPGYKLRPLDTVQLFVPERVSTELQPEEIPLSIVYEDDDLLVVDKPRGLVVHPAAGHSTGTLVNALLFHCKELANPAGTDRPGIVHRIDKDTSGLLMVAKNDFAHRGLSEQLSKHTVTRRYLGIAHGVLTHDVGTIEAPIGRHLVHRQQMAVIRTGKQAVTHFTVIERFENYT